MRDLSVTLRQACVEIFFIYLYLGVDKVFEYFSKIAYVSLLLKIRR